MSKSKRFHANCVDRAEADRWQYSVIESYGFATEAILTKGQAFTIIASLKRGDFVPDNRFTRVPATKKQLGLLWRLGVPDGTAKTKRQASLLIDAIQNPMKLYKSMLREIDKAKCDNELTVIARDLLLVKGFLPERFRAPLIEVGQDRRNELKASEIPV